MRTIRFYLPAQYQVGQTLSLDKAQAHYALNVLRLKNQQPVQVFDGQGHQAQATLIVTGRRSADLCIETVVQHSVESPLETRLLQGISKGDRMDFTLQKSVELGVSHIQPLFTERCDVKLSEDKLEKRQQHWQAIVISACEQSGRTLVPEVAKPISWTDFRMKQPPPCHGLVLDPYAEHTFKTLPDSLAQQPLHLLIGPEGGLTDTEVQQAQQLGLTPTQLGSRILRTETAGLGILAAVQARWGDF